MATIFRDPITARRRELPVGVGILQSQDGVRGDPLTTVLAGQDRIYGAPGQVPDYDWPNPRGKVFPQDQRTFVRSSSPTLLNICFSQTDWPNPRGPKYASDLRTFTNPVPLNLLSKDQFFGAPGQVSAFVLPNPTGPRRGDLSPGSQSLALYNQPIVITLPFALYDWPNPSGKSLPGSLRGFTNPVATNLIGQDQFFGAPGEVPTFDWPNPRGKVFAPDLRTFVRAVNLELLGKDQFFGLAGEVGVYAYPNPLGRQFPVSLRGFAAPIPPVVLVPPVPPVPPTVFIDFEPFADSVNRVPNPEVDNELIRRLADKLASIVNSLFRQGYLSRIGPNKFTINGGAYQLARAPDANDDSTYGVQVGQKWVNTAAGTIYICVDTTVGAAVWKQLATV